MSLVLLFSNMFFNSMQKSAVTGQWYPWHQGIKKTVKQVCVCVYLYIYIYISV